jgi:hypothetical protein
VAGLAEEIHYPGFKLKIYLTTWFEQPKEKIVHYINAWNWSLAPGLEDGLAGAEE